jgi:superfamily I DNA and/or RNA helicase
MYCSPQAVVTLRRQYRMAAPIMSLSNTLVYRGQLVAGDAAVADARLHLPRPAALDQVNQLPPVLPCGHTLLL